MHYKHRGYGDGEGGCLSHARGVSGRGTVPPCDEEQLAASPIDVPHNHSLAFSFSQCITAETAKSETHQGCSSCLTLSAVSFSLGDSDGMCHISFP